MNVKEIKRAVRRLSHAERAEVAACLHSSTNGRAAKSLKRSPARTRIRIGVPAAHPEYDKLVERAYF